MATSFCVMQIRWTVHKTKGYLGNVNGAGKRVAGICVLSSVLALTSGSDVTVQAQTVGDGASTKKAKAKEQFEEGRKAYNLQKFNSAAALFAKSYELSGNPDLLFNIAQAYRLAGQSEQAIGAYKSFLREVPDSPNREVAELKLNELQRIGSGTDSLQNSVPLERPASSGGQTRSTSLPTWAPWVAGGITAAMAVGAVYVSVGANAKFDDLKGSCGATAQGCTDSQISDLNSKARLANWLWAFTAIAAIGTGAIVYVDYSDKSSSLAIAGRF